MPYDANGNYYASSTADRNAPSDLDTSVGQYIPLDLFGSSGRIQAQRDAATQDANRGYWNSIAPPTADQLSDPQGVQAQRAALAQMQQWGQGGVTATDRAGLESQRQRDAQASGSAQRSIMQNAQARGVGGSGLDYATRMQASQQGQQQSSDAESQMLQGAQQRALQAMSASAALGGQMRDQAANGATQQAFTDQTQRAAGATNQYSQDAATTQAGRDRKQQSDMSAVGLLHGLFSS